MLEGMIAKAEWNSSLPTAVRAAKVLTVAVVTLAAGVVTEKVFDGGIRSYIAKAAEVAA